LYFGGAMAKLQQQEIRTRRGIDPAFFDRKSSAFSFQLLWRSSKMIELV
jgi:hypothetical protein